MTTSYREQQKSIVWNLLADANNGRTDTIARLTDKVGLSPDKFTDHHYRVAYQSFQDVFIKSQTGGQSFSLPSVLGSIEENYRTNGHASDAEQLMKHWSARTKTLEGAQLSNPYSAAAILMRANIRDQFQILSDGLYERVRTAEEPAAELADIAAEINALASAHGEQVSSYRQELVHASGLKPISCGNAWMDEHILWNKLANKGGFSPEMLVSWFAPSENGKTSAATTFATSWIARGFPCLMLTAEESRTNFAVRVVNAYTGLPASEIIDAIPQLENTENLTEIQKEIAETLDYMDEMLYTYEIASLDTIERYVRRHRTQFGYEIPILVMVDHIGATDSGKGNWSREMEQSAKRLKEIAMRYMVTMLVFGQASSQMEEDFKEKNYTTEKDMRGSHGVRQWSDYVVGSCRHNGNPLPIPGVSRFNTATVVHSIKNRFRDDSRKLSFWGVFDFDVLRGTIAETLITDDFQLQVSMTGD